MLFLFSNMLHKDSEEARRQLMAHIGDDDGLYFFFNLKTSLFCYITCSVLNIWQIKTK